MADSADEKPRYLDEVFHPGQLERSDYALLGRGSKAQFEAVRFILA